MSAARKEFLVVALGDRDAYGFNEHTLPILVRLIESSAPDTHLTTHQHVVGYYLPSAHSIAAIRDLVSAAEMLRDRDTRFASLGIGIARGPLIAEFQPDGRINASTAPMGETVNKASAGVGGPQHYRDILNKLC